LSLTIFSEKSKALVKKHLSLEILKTLEPKKTDSGFTLAQAINSGIKNVDSSIGIYAGDAASYKTFALLFDPIICDYHGFSKTSSHTSDLTPVDLPILDPESLYIKSTRIRVARNLKGFNFPCNMSLPQRSRLEKKITSAFGSLEKNLNGEYFSFEKMKQAISRNLEPENLSFRKGDRFQDAAGINADFPKCRGVFRSRNKQFMVWVNEEDHLRIISLEKNSDISSVFNRLCHGVLSLNQSLGFERDDRYGYLTSCPTNIGTSMRASVHIRLEKLEKKKELLLELTKRYNLQLRGTCGEKTKVSDSLFDISNRQRLGLSESAIIENLYHGIASIIKTERNL